MGKIAFLFAGEGAQYKGMGKDLFFQSEVAVKYFDFFDKYRPGTSETCFNKEIKSVDVQSCVYAVNMAAAKVLLSLGIKPDGMAGYSVGELAALTFAGYFRQDDGFNLAGKRAQLVEKYSLEKPGDMLCVQGLADDRVEAVCQAKKLAWPASYNYDGEVYVSAPASFVGDCVATFQNAGGTAQALRAGGAWHSPVIKAAADLFGVHAKTVKQKEAQMPVYSSVTASLFEPDTLGKILGKAVDGPVLWKQTIRAMAQDGFDTFIEVGPGQVLSGWVQRILPQARVFAAQDMESMTQVARSL